MIKIEEASIKDLEIIHQLAHDIWWPTYKNVVSDEQIAFMLDKMYSTTSLKNQMEEGNVFLLLYVDEKAKGFACFSKTAVDQIYKLQKLYLQPDQQGKGTGKLLLSSVEEKVKKLGATTLILNVNRGNKAQFFYQKVGYQIIEEVNIPYFHFVLNDYVMSKTLN
jgi:GNAT superfamily N-acetyltransferase